MYDQANHLERAPPLKKLMGTSTTYSNEKAKKLGEITTWSKENCYISVLKDSLEENINSLDIKEEKEALTAEEEELRKG